MLYSLGYADPWQPTMSWLVVQVESGGTRTRPRQHRKLVAVQSATAALKHTPISDQHATPNARNSLCRMHPRERIQSKGLFLVSAR